MPKAKATKPEPKRRHTLHIRVEPSLAEWIARHAKLDGRTVNNWCERVLKQACLDAMHEANRRDVRAGKVPPNR